MTRHETHPGLAPATARNHREQQWMPPFRDLMCNTVDVVQTQLVRGAPFASTGARGRERVAVLSVSGLG
ncbi:hypothetical protein [Curtobacterium sp. MCPF17_052]|uniref:hypothetical protein n=1 Tax=Curtobacterium sp. MCPF17_052 TaxID=2175655 RepID=UPI0011B67BC0|nr:hypothetical protein [Curtobacterium sp. MCPF17_052]WIB13398.1 hypothetical protein DEJ36_06180 [Curtobacterium sp. MCPF17_052]